MGRPDVNQADAEIAFLYGDVTVKVLRRIYGMRFAPGHSDCTPLNQALSKLDEADLREIRKDAVTGVLSAKIEIASELSGVAYIAPRPVTPAMGHATPAVSRSVPSSSE